MRSWLVTVAVVLASALSASAKQPLPDVDALSPHVGEEVPDFALVDQNGTEQTLQSILGPNGALLVFTRSASW